MYLLDTNVLSELRKAPATRSPQVTAWATAQNKEILFISVVSLMEIRRGIVKLEQRGDAVQAAMLTRWLHQHILPAFSGRIFSIDPATALRAAELPWSAPNDYRDALIAATALTHGMTVVSRNIKDFAATGAKLLNPWEVTP
ncbi:MAG: type II toxin-antitoxin system VapC family toxin [Desulfobulbus sp.]|nr:type II toxin-antitoxin system VapC family toxin [Desulfobulbus sp.]